MERWFIVTRQAVVMYLENVWDLFQNLINGTGILFGTLRAVIFVIFMALIFGYFLQNRQAPIPKKWILAFVVFAIVIAVYVLFIN